MRYYLTVSSVRPLWARPHFPVFFLASIYECPVLYIRPNIINELLCIHSFVADNDLSVLPQLIKRFIIYITSNESDPHQVRH